MGVQNFIGQLPYIMITPWFLRFMQNEQWFDNMIDGAAGTAIIIGALVIAVGILPAVFLRERYKELATSELKGKEAASYNFV